MKPTTMNKLKVGINPNERLNREVAIRLKIIIPLRPSLSVMAQRNGLANALLLFNPYSAPPN